MKLKIEIDGKIFEGDYPNVNVQGQLRDAIYTHYDGMLEDCTKSDVDKINMLSDIMAFLEDRPKGNHFAWDDNSGELYEILS